MISSEQVEKALEAVPIPGIGLSLNRLNMIQGIEIQDNSIKLTLASTGLSRPVRNGLKPKSRKP
jgi:metal-sulfur cluster biosynthetic enzyme